MIVDARHVLLYRGARYPESKKFSKSKKVENFSKSPIVWLDARHVLHCRESMSEEKKMKNFSKSEKS